MVHDARQLDKFKVEKKFDVIINSENIEHIIDDQKLINDISYLLNKNGLLYLTTPNLFFSLLAWVGKSELLFAFAVLLDDLATAFATVAFVAFISLLVDRTYTATHYALIASIGTAGRTCLLYTSDAADDMQ